MTDPTTTTAPTPPIAPGPAAWAEPAYRSPVPGVPPQPLPPLQPVPLGYEPPRSRPPPVPFEDVLMYLFRRAVFALGVGLLAAGLVAGFATRATYRDSYMLAGWGAALIALVVPFPALWRHWPKR